jgi:uncharacterized membrane-anchored protein
MREKGLAMSGAVVVMRQNRLMQRFRDVKATNPKSAITLDAIGCRNSWIFRRMAARGVFIETGKARYYMDEDAAKWFVRRRRRVMFIFVAVAILLFVIWQICS